MYLVGRGCIHELEYERTGICHPRDESMRKQEREKTMDEFGILHGEDAKRFHEYMNNPEPLNERAQEMVKRAQEHLKDVDKMICAKECKRLLDDLEEYNRLCEYNLSYPEMNYHTLRDKIDKMRGE